MKITRVEPNDINAIDCENCPFDGEDECHMEDGCPTKEDAAKIKKEELENGI